MAGQAGANGTTWFRVALFLGGILAGTVGAGGVGALQYSKLEAAAKEHNQTMERRVDEDHERLVRVEQDVQWVRQTLDRLFAKIDDL